MRLNICKNYDNTLSKEENNKRVSHGWGMQDVKWQEDEIVNLTTENGISGNEYSDGHRTNDSWVATHALMLDFDDGSMTVDELLKLQKKWGYNSYVFSSQNHQKCKPDSTSEKVCDRLRVLIPLASPIDNEHDLQNVENAFVDYFQIKGKQLDATCFQRNRYFAHGTAEVSSFIGDQGCLVWQDSPGISGTNQKVRKRKGSSDKDTDEPDLVKTGFTLEDEVKDKDGNSLTIKDITEKTIIFCPLCGEAPYRNNDGHNAFIDFNSQHLPFIYCSSCDSRNMGVNGKGVYNLAADDAYLLRSKQLQVAVFIDTVNSDLYSICTEPGREKPDIRPIKNQFFAEQFCKSHGLPVPNVYPRARYEYVFDSDKMVNFEAGFINKYIAPDVLKKPVPEGYRATLPYFTDKLIDHVLAHDDEIKKHFINNLAHLVQKRTKMITSYLFQGTQGTGKGVLFGNVLMKIFGEEYCSTTSQDAFANQFNRFYSENVLVLVNEVSGNFSFSGNKNLSMHEKIKIAITEKYLHIEGKGKDRINGVNNCSFLFATNRHHGLVLERGDRRFNVAPRQECKVHLTDWWPGYKQLVKKLAAELQEFVWYLNQYPVELNRIGVVIDNEPKRVLQALSSTDADDFFEAVNNGDVSWFRDNLIRKSGYHADEKYMEIEYLIKRLSKSSRTSTTDLCRLYNYMNNKNLTVPMFSRLAKKYLKYEIKQFRKKGPRIQGIEVKWKDPEPDPETDPETEPFIYD